MAKECCPDLVRIDPFPVVCHTDQAQTAVPDLDRDGAGTCVYGILTQFFDDGTRSLNNLSGCDLVDRRLFQQTDLCHTLPRSLFSYSGFHRFFSLF